MYLKVRVKSCSWAVIGCFVNVDGFCVTVFNWIQQRIDCIMGQ